MIGQLPVLVMRAGQNAPRPPTPACVCNPHEMVVMCLGVPGETDECAACLALDPEARCLADVDGAE